MTTDEEVLAYIGRGGRSPTEVAARFPGFDVARLVRAQLVITVSVEPGDTEAHAYDVRAAKYVLTPLGASAVGMSA